jgi:hypothetical protein
MVRPAARFGAAAEMEALTGATAAARSLGVVPHLVEPQSRSSSYCRGSISRFIPPQDAFSPRWRITSPTVS